MKSKFLKRALTLGTILLVVVALVVGVALPGLAASDDTKSQQANPPTKILRGQVAAVAADKKSFTIQRGTDPAQIVIKVDDNTKYFKIVPPFKVPQVARAVPPVPNARPMVPPGLSDKLPRELKEKLQKQLQERLKNKPQTPAKDVERGLGKKGEDDVPEITDEMLSGLEQEGQQAQGHFPGVPRIINWLRLLAKKATFDDIAVGDRVIVKVMPNENLAKLVLIIKQPKIKSVRGTITAVDNTSITITPTGGTAITLKWNESTRFVLHGLIAVQAGQFGNAVYDIDTMITSVVNVRKSAPAPAPVPTPTKTLTLSSASGAAGTAITIGGSGFAASTAGSVWFDINGNNVIDAGEPQVAVTTTAAGAIPAGIILTVPIVAAGTYQIRADIPAGPPIEASAGFTVT